jgi:magnesium chelatase family protein
MYPASFQLIAAMNPCRCGYQGVAGQECPRAPKCAQEYQAKLSGPLMDRIDIHIYVPPVNPWEIFEAEKGETSAQVLARVEKAREIQKKRFEKLGCPNIRTNARLTADLLDTAVDADSEAKNFLMKSADRLKLSARGYHRTLRLARTIADLQNETKVLKMHIAEALNYRRLKPAS